MRPVFEVISGLMENEEFLHQNPDFVEEVEGSLHHIFESIISDVSKDVLDKLVDSGGLPKLLGEEGFRRITWNPHFNKNHLLKLAHQADKTIDRHKERYETIPGLVALTEYDREDWLSDSQVLSRLIGIPEFWDIIRRKSTEPHIPKLISDLAVEYFKAGKIGLTHFFAGTSWKTIDKTDLRILIAGDKVLSMYLIRRWEDLSEEFVDYIFEKHWEDLSADPLPRRGHIDILDSISKMGYYISIMCRMLDSHKRMGRKAISEKILRQVYKFLLEHSKEHEEPAEVNRRALLFRKDAINYIPIETIETIEKEAGVTIAD